MTTSRRNTTLSPFWPDDEDEDCSPSRIRLGDWLVRRGLISRADLYFALNASFEKQLRLGDALVNGGVLPRSVLEAEARRHQDFLARASLPQTVQFPLGG
jgi:hypothetical protein